jgi:hypothetical protein
VSRVVRSGCDFVDEKGVVLLQEHLNTKDTLAPEAVDGLTSKRLRFLVDVLRDAACWRVGEFADAVLVDGLHSRVGQYAVLGLDDHDCKLHLEVRPLLGVEVLVSAECFECSIKIGFRLHWEVTLPVVSLSA